MAIENVDGNEYYNYEMKDVDIVDHNQSDVLHASQTVQSTTKDYATHMRDTKQHGKCKRFGRFLYNKENRTSCNRTGRHWGSLIFYYVFFLGILLILFMCSFYGINRIMVHEDRTKPPLAHFYTNPIPTFTFVPIRVNMLSHPIIWYKFSGSNSGTNRRLEPYVAAIRDYYKSQATLCAKMKLDLCTVDPSNYGPCGDGKFGYDDQKPCILLKLNTISGWQPDAFHTKHKVPKSMPQELTNHLDLHRETVCMYCSGSSVYDREHIGKIVYYPEPCFNESYFPYADSPINVNPTIAIQLKNTDRNYL